MDDYVWIIEQGELHEGGQVTSVYRKQPTDEFIESLKTVFDEKWEKVETDVPDEYAWHSGCDYLLLKKWKVR